MSNIDRFKKGEISIEELVNRIFHNPALSHQRRGIDTEKGAGDRATEKRPEIVGKDESAKDCCHAL